MFGFEETEIVGRPISLLVPARYKISYPQGLVRMDAAGEPTLVDRMIRMHGKRKDGSEFPLELSLSSWQNQGRTFYTGILLDRTRGNALEEMWRRYEFMANASK